MSYPIVIENRYVPKVGEGRALAAALQETSDVWKNAGLPGLELWRSYHGPHNAVATIQRWPSMEAYHETRPKVVEIPELVSVVFDKLYPTNAAAYDTSIFEVIGR